MLITMDCHQKNGLGTMSYELIKKKKPKPPTMDWVSLTLPQVGEPHPALYPQKEGQSWVGYSSFRVASLGSRFFPGFISFRASSLLGRLLFTRPSCDRSSVRLFSLGCLLNDVCESWTALYFPALSPFTSTWPEIKIEWMTIQQGSPRSNPGKWGLLGLGYMPIIFLS